MDSTGTMILSLIALVALSAFFSASETAYTSLNRVRVKNMANAGNRRAEKVLKLAENYDKLLSGILVGNNIVNILSASLATILFVSFFGSGGVSVSTAVMTVLVLMFGEIAPKSIAKDHAEELAFAFYPVLGFIIRVLTPLIYLATLWQRLVYRVFKPSEDKGITEEELITIVDEAESGGEIDSHESELIRSAIEFNDLTVEEILTPRVDVTAVDIGDSLDDIAKTFEESGYSRIPVYDGSVDNIVGILHEKDFFTHRNTESIRDMMTKPLCVMPTTELPVLLKLLQKTKNHMAVVMDEYGGVLGIATMEDVLEELVGEIWDEHDEVEEDFIELPDGGLRVAGGASLDDLRERMAIPDEYDSVTVNGWVLEVLGRFPQPGDSFDFADRHITVEKIVRRRVEQITIEPIEADGANSTQTVDELTAEKAAI
ncbi:MAG: HlyC/CorC family transporter [bacterium]